MILAAGFGTRLGELTSIKPKPMLPVVGVPLVRWAALWLRHHGVQEIAVNLHHLGGQIREELGSGEDLGVRFSYSDEEGLILGTGGGLRQARPLIDDGDETPIVVVNGKIMLDLDLGQVIERHVTSQAEATMVLRADPSAAKWGSLQVDGQGRVVRLLGAAPRGDAEADPASPPLMFTGVHVIQPRFLDRIPPEGEQCIIRTAYSELFHEARGLLGWQTDAYWWEHSTPERYLQGVFNVLDGKAQLHHAPGPVRGVSAEANVHPNARVVDPVFIGPGTTLQDGCVVGPHVQLGANVTVERDARIERSIVWDGATVQGAIRDQVIAG